MPYDNDYPTEPIGGGNPYHRCHYCKVPVPQINGNVRNHKEDCVYRLHVEKDEMTRYLLHLISMMYMDLPSNRDWLDPDIEREMKRIYEGHFGKQGLLEG